MKYILLLLCTIPLLCGAQDYNKMSRFVRSLVHESGESRAKCSTRNTPETFVALVKGTEESIAPYCITHEGDIHIANIPVDQLSALSLNGGIERIEAHEVYSTACMDKSAEIVHATSAWQGIDLPQSFTGAGTLVGINDIGFDFTHPAFLSASTGKPRITHFWDMPDMDSNTGSNYNKKLKFPIGKFYNNADDILRQAHSLDGKEIFHGTHIMATAAGSAAGTPYSGIAPEAEIYVVNNILSNNYHLLPKSYNINTEELRLLGWKNIFDYADSIGKPAVINYSAGSVMDITDSYNLINEYVKRITKPGHIIVASAGNNGEDNSYINKDSATKEVGGQLSSANTVAYINISTSETNLVFTLYCAGEGNKVSSKSYHLDFKLNSKIKENKDGLLYNHQITDTLDIDMDSLRVIIHCAPDETCPQNMGYEFCIIKGKKAFNDGKYYIGIEGGEASIFIENASCNAATDFNPSYKGAEKLGNVLSPGCLESVITVGSTAHATSFTNQYGEAHVKDFGSEGLRASFSSSGPNTHGIIKPDIMAPGVNIVSALNSFYVENNTSDKDLDKKIITWTEQNGKKYPYIAQRGTSMSTPIVTGAIALWLEADPTLTTEKIKKVFEATAKHCDPKEEHYPNNHYGYGEIDIYKGLLYILGLTDVPGISTSHAKNMKVASTNDGNIIIRFDNETVKSTSYSLYTRGGQLIGKGTIPANTTTFTIPSHSQGIIVIQVDGYGSSIVAHS